MTLLSTTLLRAFAKPGSGRLDLVPPEHALQAVYAESQAAEDEKASLPYPCDKGCGAPAWQLCYSPTGLPASAPCPERVRGVRA